MKKLDLKKIKADYELNGVTVIRDVIDKKWIHIMQTAIDSILNNPGLASI